MAFSYLPDQSNEISKIRFLLGDVKDAGHDLEDEEITAVYNSEGSIKKAAAALAWSLHARYSRLADVNVDDQLTRYSDMAKNWAVVATRLTNDASAETAAPTPTNPGTTYAAPIVTGLNDCRGPLDRQYDGYRGRFC